MTDETKRIRADIEEMFNRYHYEDSLIGAIVMYVEHEKFTAKHDGAMMAVDKVKESFGVKE